MNIAEIDQKLVELIDSPFEASKFIFGLMAAYNAPKSTIEKLKQGVNGKADFAGDFIWPKMLFFRTAPKGKVAEMLDEMAASPILKKNAPRFILATDGHEVAALDTKSDDTRHGLYSEMNEHFDFFLPLAGQELYEAVKENPADVKASAKMAKFYDEVLKANPDWKNADHTHELNLFMTRVLFCLFAQSTGIFDENLFIKTLHNAGDDIVFATREVTEVFEALDTVPEERVNFREYAKRFPYVNGGLFRARTRVPKFSRKSLRLLVEAAKLRWNEINPDIFGSMIQAVVQTELRGDLGMHYTSVPNIMKVLQPLFLMSLEEEFETGRDSEAKLDRLLTRIHNIRVFDPACGSGNFLIIAYRELRKIETRIFQRLNEISKQFILPMSGIKLDSFYGIELDDFACETAKLSLWIAEYQANQRFKDVFGKAPPALPLRDGGHIVHGNALRLDWATVATTDGEIYVVGNPPFHGGKVQTQEQKNDLKQLFEQYGEAYKTLDYVACWYLLAAQFCSKWNSQSGLVATNSICQGEQVAMLWPIILGLGIEISFAHSSFKWKNNAAKNAGVTCIIVGLRRVQNVKKNIYADNAVRTVKNIGPYLIEMDNFIVRKRQYAFHGISKITLGNMAKDGGNLILHPAEMSELAANYPQARRFIKRLYGSQEFIKGVERYCLWIEDKDVPEAISIPPIADRIEKTKKMRLESDAESTRQYAQYGHRFKQIQNSGKNALIIPIVSSANRKYIPVGFLDDRCIISNLAFAIYDAPAYLFSIIASRLHMVWTAAVGGRLKTDYRYSNTLVYNTFPIPALSDDQRQELEDHTWQIIKARESYSGKTIAWLYAPKTMPANLAKAHHALDEALERIYIGRPFKDDTERLEHLFKLYALMTKKAEPAKKAG